MWREKSLPGTLMFLECFSPMRMAACLPCKHIFLRSNRWVLYLKYSNAWHLPLRTEFEVPILPALWFVLIIFNIYFPDLRLTISCCFREHLLFLDWKHDEADYLMPFVTVYFPQHLKIILFVSLQIQSCTLHYTCLKSCERTTSLSFVKSFFLFFQNALTR